MNKVDTTDDRVVLIADERHIDFLRSYFDRVILERAREETTPTASLADPHAALPDVVRMRQWIADLDRGVIVGQRDVLAETLSECLDDLARSHQRTEDDHEPFAHLLRQLPS